MDEPLLSLEKQLFQTYEPLRLQNKYLVTPDVENVVYFAVGHADGQVVRGTCQANGTWTYDYVPCVGY